MATGKCLLTGKVRTGSCTKFPSARLVLFWPHMFAFWFYQPYVKPTVRHLTSTSQQSGVFSCSQSLLLVHSSYTNVKISFLLNYRMLHVAATSDLPDELVLLGKRSLLYMHGGGMPECFFCFFFQIPGPELNLRKIPAKQQINYFWEE